MPNSPVIEKNAFPKALGLAPLLAAFGSYPNGVMEASS